MRQYSKQFLLIFSIFLFSTSCQYELSGGFNREVSKPDASHPANITLSFNKDSIIIYDVTDVNYSVNSFGLNCNNIEIEFLDTKFNNSFNSSGSFTLTPDFSVKDWFDLKVKFYLSTGTGSIADRLKAENYIGSKTWKVRFFDISTYDFKFQEHVNSDGILELFWIKPTYLTSLAGEIDRPTSVELLPSKVSGDTIFYADKDFCGNEGSYNLYLYANNNHTYRHIVVTPNYPYPELKVTPMGIDSCLVTWTPSPIKRYYKLNEKYSGFGNSYKEQITLGETQFYDLHIFPPNYKSSLFGVKSTWLNYTVGTKAEYSYCYSKAMDKFYLSKSSIMPNITSSILPLPSYDYSIDGTGASYSLVCNNQGTCILGLSYDAIKVFDQNYNTIKTVNLAAGSLGATMCDLADDGSYGNFPNNKNYIIKNFGSDNSWSEFSFEPKFVDNPQWKYEFGISLTVDGKYVACRGGFDFYLYDVSDHKTANIVYIAPMAEVYRAMGNPLNSKELIVSCVDKIEVRTCPEFQLIKKFELAGFGLLVALNVDTYSNLLLIYSQSYYHIINLATMKELTRFKRDYYHSARLYRKQLIFTGNLVIDLTPYLK